MHKVLAVGLGVAGALLLACTGPKGEPGDPGPQGQAGAQGPPGTTTFGGITDVPPALVLPFPGGVSSAIISQIVVTAAADCGSISPAPRLEVYVDGVNVGGTDVTQSTFADTSPFPINPARYAHEVAVAFTNDNQNGTCDHNLHVQQIKLTTAAGPVTIQATDAAHVLYDRGAFFDNVDVGPATMDLGLPGALRFFLSHTAGGQTRVTNAIATGGGLPRSGTFTTSGGPVLVLAHASAFNATSTGLRVDISIDGTLRSSLSGYTNETGSHKALPGAAFVVPGLAAGPHNVVISLGVGSADSNDYSQVTIVELPN
ncbi:MAG TPA: collagen-like protein [Myxococcales bacterium]|nr:collagen-like protein [Myxococcales bacterium]